MEDGGGASVESVEPEPEPEDNSHINTSDLEHSSDSSEDELGEHVVAEDESTMDPATEDGTEGRSTAELHTNDSEDESSDSDSDDSLAQDDAALKNNLESIICDEGDSLGPVHASQDLQLSSDSSNDSLSSPVTSDLNSTIKSDTIPSESEEGVICGVNIAPAVPDVQQCKSPEARIEPRTVNDWADALEAVCQEDASVEGTPVQVHLQDGGEVNRTSEGSHKDTNVTVKQEEPEEGNQSNTVGTVENSEVTHLMGVPVSSGENEACKTDDCRSLSDAQVSFSEVTNQMGESVEYDRVKQNLCPVNILTCEPMFSTNNGIDQSSVSSLSEHEEDKQVSEEVTKCPPHEEVTECPPHIECSENVNLLLPSAEGTTISLSEPSAENNSIQDQVSCQVGLRAASVSESNKPDVDTSVSEDDKSTLDTSISESEKAETSVSGSEAVDESKGDDIIKLGVIAEESEDTESTVNTSKETADTLVGEVGAGGSEGEGTGTFNDKERASVADVTLVPVDEKGYHEDSSAEEDGSEEDDDDDDNEDEEEEEDDDEDEDSEDESEEDTIKVNGEFNESMDCDETDSTCHESRITLSRGPTGKPIIMSNALNAAWKKRFSSPSTQARSETNETDVQSVSEAGSSIITASEISSVPTTNVSDAAEQSSSETTSLSTQLKESASQVGLFPPPLTFSQSHNPNLSQDDSVASTPQAPSQLPKKVIRVQPSEPHRKRISRVSKGLLQPRYPARFTGISANVTSSFPDYPQYLGLQPTLRFKCVRCGEKGFTSMMELKKHQYACLKNPEPPCSPHQASSSPEPSTNFRITRKVYLCSACGTYYENWNLFLHMREVHKRHICLFCLGMFSQAEKLSLHLVSKHKVTEGHYTSAEDFKFSFKGNCFLMCCTCEKMFTEENFTNHNCRRDGTVCSICGGYGAHTASCSTRNHLVNATKKSVTLPQQDKTARMSGVKPSEASEIASVMQPLSTPSSGTTNQLSHQSSISSRTQHRHVSTPEREDEFDASRYCQINFTDEKHQNKQASAGKPRQVLKVKIPTVPPKLPENSLADGSAGLASVSSLPISTATSAVSHDDHFSNVSHERCTNLTSIMTNLERTINAVALGLTGEAQEWERRKEDERRRIEEARLIYTDTEEESDEENHSTQILSSHSSSSEEEEVEDEATEQVPLTAEQQPELAEQAPELIPEHISDHEEEHVEQAPELLAPTPPPPPSPPKDKGAAGEQASEESDDSDKLSLVVDESGVGSGDENTTQDAAPDQASPEGGCGETPVNSDMNPLESNLAAEQPLDENLVDKPSDGISLAGQDVPETDLALDKPLDLMKVQEVLKECVRTLCYTCVFCSHAKRIAVNGKQLALHVLAEHRFVPSDGTDNEVPAGARLITKLKDALESLQDTYFNTDSYDSTDKANSLPYDRSYECFHCHFYTRLHKELYIHNRKMHQKTILLCIMCKSNFYSYSELLCHLCPGIYIPQCNVNFRCCMCEVDSLPSAFRLMVHLRKRHHACDVCLESTDDQQKLSNHVWKHKLHHLCYRCGIAYRNKPDITKHLFWKHGTESVLCKKCLQKKWPHVYHFCIPPASFVCEECSVTFSRAVSLRVHKRLHTGDFRYQCSECEDKFISKKLLIKHEDRHRAPPQLQTQPQREEEEKENLTPQPESQTSLRSETNEHDEDRKKKPDAQAEDRDRAGLGNTSPTERRHQSKKKKHKRDEEKKEEEKEQKKAVDVFDLPPLNLSSESDSSDEEEKKEHATVPTTEQSQTVAPASPLPNTEDRMEVEEPTPVVDGIWDKFQNYKASLEKRDSPEDTESLIRKSIMMDHDYCIVSEKPPDAGKETSEVKTENSEDIPKSVEEGDAAKTPNSSPIKKKKSPKKRVRQNSGRRSSSSSSDSSSDSDSSSCSCGTNCSCSSSSSSSSGSSSSSSDSEDSSSSEGCRKSALRKEQRKERAEAKKKKEEEEDTASAAAPAFPKDSEKVSQSSIQAAVEEPHIDVMESEPAIRESDLDTTETDTDEDFYDDNPQKLANELLQEKRNLMLLATVAPINNGCLSPAQSQSSQPSFTTSLEPTVGKKKNKKRRKKQAAEAQAKQEGAEQLLTLQEGGQPYQQQSYQDSYQQQQQHLYESEQQNTTEAEHDPSTSLYPTSLYFTPKTPAPVTNTTTASTSFSQPGSAKTKKPQMAKVRDLSIQSTGSGSETEGRTKRKRMPNRFYGYSSGEDDENNQQPTAKWRKATPSTSYQVTMLPPVQPVQPPMPTFTIKRSMLQQPSEPECESPPPQASWSALTVPAPKSDSDSNSGAEQVNGSSSSDSDDDAMQIAESPTPQFNPVRATENKDNLYCYCQCPYDEVSEMIACDGEDCKIEWFHFECVGIMVPPKGQWYCPDCRRRMEDGLDYMLN